MGRTQPGVLAKPADRSIKRMMQPRDEMPDGDCWESPVEGETRRKAGYTPTFFTLREGHCRQGMERAYEPVGDPGYGHRYAGKERGALDLKPYCLHRAPAMVSGAQVG